jgi:signal transduction histidine kinase
VNLRGQILLVMVVLAVVPLLLATQAIRSAVTDRFTALDTARVENQIRTVLDDIDRQSTELAVQLDRLAFSMDGDNDLRLGLGGSDETAREYVLDFAPRQMAVMDLDMLLLQDAAGTVLSSGHFRNAYGETGPDLDRLVARISGDHALLAVRTPRENFLALARTRAVILGGRRYLLTGGVRLDENRLMSLDREGDLALGLVWPEGSFATTAWLAEALDSGRGILEAEYVLRRRGLVVRTRLLPLAGEGGLEDAWLVVTHDQEALQGLLDAMDFRLGIVLLAAIGGSILLAVLLAGRISRPLRDLADRTEGLDLDSLEVEFASKRKDEVGRLTRLLGEMTVRLRDGVRRLQGAERRATLGEVARQVNHDVRNGLTPLRNVIRHLAEVARNEPGRLGEIFLEREKTLEGGLDYLEDLASRYAKISPELRPEPCDLAAVVRAVLEEPAVGPGVRLVNAVPAALPPIEADPVSLRRIFDNLVRNAVESLPGDGGTVTVDAAVAEDPRLDEVRILVSVSDDGEGIAPENIDAVFTDFFTTKEGGTGLGLSNVRRLAADCGATIGVTSEVGRGTTFTLSFPLATRPHRAGTDP